MSQTPRTDWLLEGSYRHTDIGWFIAGILIGYVGSKIALWWIW